MSVPEPPAAPSGPMPTILEGIVRRRCVEATYNRQRVTLAPHILYTRHDELHIDAVALERDGKPPRELKLGTYRLTGLTDIAPSERPFFPIESFDPAAEIYRGVTMLAVDRS